MNRQVDKAVLNNIIWCGIVCEMHGITHTSRENMWGLLSKPPKFYPDIITSSEKVTTQEVIDFIGDREIFSIKDSFSNLDLASYGYKILFESEWIYHAPVSNFEQIGPAWRVIKTEKELMKWTSAHDLVDIIKPDILRRKDVEIYIHEANDKLSGFIANLSAHAVGISNVFLEENAYEKIWSDITQIASSRFPGLPAVGYEHGDDLNAALGSGWRSIGSLRVWMKDNS